ncbi:MAG: cyclase family protein [Planctomycetia bacterium]
MRIHDISRPVRPGIPVWPGDTPYAFRFVARIAEGSSVNVGRVEMSVHTGAHVDAPLHFADGAPDAAAVPLEACVGPCVVLEVAVGEGGVKPSDLPPGADGLVRQARRLLLRCYARRPGAFDTHMRHATPALADWLHERGVLLLGIDTDSMDAFDSKDLPAHHRLQQHGITILEGIDLSAVRPGTYELVALPLRLEGADASPVRAVLLER